MSPDELLNENFIKYEIEEKIEKMIQRGKFIIISSHISCAGVDCDDCPLGERRIIKNCGSYRKHYLENHPELTL